MVPAASTLPTLMTSLRKRVYETLPPSALWKSRASLRSTRNICFQGWMKFLLSLTCAQPSFMTATPPWPSTLDVWRPRGRDMVEPLYWVGPVRELGVFRLMLDMLPGRKVMGVRLRRGLSVGGRGAGPGFMNCPEEQILLGIRQPAAAPWSASWTRAPRATEPGRCCLETVRYSPAGAAASHSSQQEWTKWNGQLFPYLFWAAMSTSWRRRWRYQYIPSGGSRMRSGARCDCRDSKGGGEH